MTDPMLNPDIPSPCYVCEEAKLEANLQLMQRVQQESGVEIILALKGFPMWSTFDLVKQYLQGSTASAVWEARLGKEEIGKQVHAFSPAFKPADIDQLVDLVDHISFNSFGQWNRFKAQILQSNVSPGIRLNAEHREADTELYDPSAPGSRFGILAKDLKGADLSGLEGFHIHNLCECDSFATERTILAVEEKFGQYFEQIKWINFGGGHLMTKDGYDVEHLIATLKAFKARHPHLNVILEPGSAVAWQTGPLVCEVIDIVENRDKIAIVDMSATAHMPDVLEMPYRPDVRGAGKANEKAFTYRFGGNSCLTGDAIDLYSFDHELQIGERIIFEDMIHYTMVKTTFFNGVEHPSIGILRKNGEFELVRKFEYEDFKNKLS
ncbi:carboxynorspermidine decarboxylase [Paraglaciecola sp. T6c]|uniref:carboxynorspermidine decarboxylase n=1 Tax=Pseudoalteromonas atlantica (strain T6c / ATCC BAA-1087) TaxID=3042615 RepID=UPI0002DF6383|nr:carboxynorspermidine decarboxylase [Paraglaciecola sp. T6c]